MLFEKIALQFLEECDEISLATKRTYFYGIKKVSKFKPQLEIEEIDSTLIREYKKYLIEIGNQEASIAKALSVFRNFTHRMLYKGYLSDDPFKGIKIKRVLGHRQFIALPKLKKLYYRFLDEKETLMLSEQQAMEAFLFSCFTGLRYSDLKTLTFAEISGGRVRKQTHKTGECVYIPLSLQAQLIIQYKINSSNSHERVFKVAENSSFNKRLRSAAKKLGLNDYIHCHIARHTFATTCLTLDIPLAITSKLLGHRDISTTQIYAKYIDLTLDREMRKFRKW